MREVAHNDPTASDLQKGTIMAAVGNILNQLRRAEAEGSDRVMTSPPDGPAARLQSLIASGEAATLTLEPLPAGGLEAKFDTNDWFGWASVAWTKLNHIRPHEMVRPPNDISTNLPDEARIALLGDWGTGLYGAPKIGASVCSDTDPFFMLLHLGDVYYSGTNEEERNQFLNVWPRRRDAINRALNSNHEMYSGGDAYFEEALPKFGQEGSYFAYENKNWLLVGLDVAYRDHAIDDTQVDWLGKVIAAAGNRRLILFSHHQLYSHFESQGVKLWQHPGFGKILRSKRVFAWYWGHEHRCAIFEDKDPTFGLYARCIGHSGMPQSRDRTRGLPLAEEHPAAEWRRSPRQIADGDAFSRAAHS
jgi:Calcineurin-like phosphoesterase